MPAKNDQKKPAPAKDDPFDIAGADDRNVDYLEKILKDEKDPLGED